MDDHTPPGDTHGGHVEHAYAVSPPHFAFDDAFSDADDAEERLEFSPEAIREDIAKTFTNLDKHVAQDEAEDFARKIGFAVDSNTSVSTFDIDAAASEPRSPAASPPGMVRSMSTASHVTSLASPGSLYDIPLSESASGLRISDEPSSYFHEHDAAEQVRDAIPERKSSPKPAQEHPPVVVEVKSDPVHETDNYVEVAPRSVSHDEFRARTVSPQLTTPQYAASIVSSLSAASIASTSTSHIPTSASLPSPASNASNVSNMSNMSNMSTTSTTSAPSTFQHRQVRSLGPSALDRFISHTRPSFLPPKPRTEDKKHLADWEAMMKRSRVAEEKRRKALQERRYARERKIEESIGIWERDIVPDWTVVQRNPAMRKLWWGGIPTKLRATMWQNAAGNALVLNKDTYKTCLSRANKAIAHGTFPTTVLGMIEEDIKTTLPTLHVFMPGTGPMYQDLKDMLCAWVVSRSDEGLGYVYGIAKVAAMILLNMAAPQGFVVMRNLLERHCMRSFYGGLTSKDDAEAYYRIFDTLLADGMPKIYFNFKQHQISPSSYLPEWLIPLFLDHLPFEACARIWDILLLEGDPFLYRAAIGILAVLEPRLFFPDRRELLELLKGENKAAIDAAKREGRPLDGPKYEIYGVDEETLWERLDSMDEWWRESTWTRLIQRELPDL